MIIDANFSDMPKSRDVWVNCIQMTYNSCQLNKAVI